MLINLGDGKLYDYFPLVIIDDGTILGHVEISSENHIEILITLAPIKLIETWVNSIRLPEDTLTISPEQFRKRFVVE